MLPNYPLIGSVPVYTPTSKVSISLHLRKCVLSCDFPQPDHLTGFSFAFCTLGMFWSSLRQGAYLSRSSGTLGFEQVPEPRSKLVELAAADHRGS